MFKFRAEKVLFLKGIQEKKAMEKLGEVRLKISSLTAEIEKRKNNISEALHFLGTGVSTTILEQGHSYRDYINSEIVKITEKIDEMRKHEEAAKKNLEKAMSERKALTKLKERHTEQYKAEMKKKENKKIDEITTIKAYEKTRLISG